MHSVLRYLRWVYQRYLRWVYQRYLRWVYQSINKRLQTTLINQRYTELCYTNRNRTDFSTLIQYTDVAKLGVNKTIDGFSLRALILNKRW